MARGYCAPRADAQARELRGRGAAIIGKKGLMYTISPLLGGRFGEDARKSGGFTSLFPLGASNWVKMN